MDGLSNKSLELLYIMSKLTESNKFVGKGGNVVILNTYDKTSMLRLSNDVDVTYIWQPNDDLYILDIIKSIFNNENVYISRSSASNVTLQIMINNIPIDIETNRKINILVQEYKFNNYNIIAVDYYDLLVDKLAVVSSRKVFRRCKDLIDIYNIITNYIVCSDIILERFKSNKRELGSFSELYNNKENIQHAYTKLELNNPTAIKEDFELVYDTIVKFARGIDSKLKWDYIKLTWVNQQEDITTSESLGEILKEQSIPADINKDNKSIIDRAIESARKE